jgi:Domain of unknown function (DUF4279)
VSDSKNQLVYAFGGEIDAGEFVLQVTADDLNPDQVSELLGCQPTDSHRCGDSSGKRGHTYKFGLWQFSTARLNFRDGKSCEEQFDEFIRNLPDTPSAWEHIASKYEARVIVYLWMRTWNREFDISVFALGELSRRRLRLHIDTYSVEE